jgi:PLAT/LH2 domain/Glycerophosphoryl diester phosphodiesterase family
MVTYVYTINVESSMRLFIDAGVDGIITDDVPKLGRVLRERSDVFLATVHDNPFKPRNETYGIKITTADVSGAGTDAHLTFTLNGTLGVATITVDTEPTGRMEAGKTNYVTVPSKDLGSLKSITIHNDGTGNKPDWNLHDLTVFSGQWLKPDLSFHYTATLDDWVRGNSSMTLAFRVDEYVWGGFASSSEGTLKNPWKRISDGYNSVAPGGIIHISTGLYREKVTLTKPCRLEFSGVHGLGPAVIGSP